jgi:hypothetical protein
VVRARHNPGLDGRPDHLRRTLLTGGVAGFAAAAGAVLGGPQPASAGTTTVDWIPPSGDTAGEKDATAIHTALGAGGMAWLAPGTFYINRMINVPHKTSLCGTGALTRIMCLGTGGFSMHDPVIRDGNQSGWNSSGCIRDLIIDGTSTGAGAVGLDIGDGWGYRLDHLFVENFTGASAIGINIINRSYFTEKMEATNIHVRNCTTQVALDTAIPARDHSHGYNDLEFYLEVEPGQSGVVARNGVNLYSSSLRIRGNFYGPSSAAVLTLTGQDGIGDYSIIQASHIQITGETDAGHSGPQTIAFGTPSNGNQMINNYGIIKLTGAFTASNAVPGCFTFGGILIGDSVLQTVNTAPLGWL